MPIECWPRWTAALPVCEVAWCVNRRDHDFLTRADKLLWFRARPLACMDKDWVRFAKALLSSRFRTSPLRSAHHDELLINVVVGLIRKGAATDGFALTSGVWCVDACAA
jgi:hypothetical protein